MPKRKSRKPMLKAQKAQDDLPCHKRDWMMITSVVIIMILVFVWLFTQYSYV